MIEVYWKLSFRRILYSIQISHFIIQSVSHLPRGNKRLKRRAKSIFFTPSLVGMEETETDLDVLDLYSFEITNEEFIKWLGMLGTDNVRSMDDLMKLKIAYESVLVRF